MPAAKWWTLVINVLGGAAVLGSYAWGLGSRPNAAAILWGGVPEALQPLYTANMFVAAAGYFAFTYFILFRLPATRVRIAGRWGYGAFNLLYALILLPSALWMPLSLLAAGTSSSGLLWAVRFVLAMVGLGSLGLLWALLNVEPPRPVWARWLAVIGCIGFCLQTVVLDAIVWSALFHL